MRELVQQAMVGDREAFGELARLWIDRLYAIARLILRDSDQAQDATQEALIVAWRDLPGLRDPDRFEPWLRRLHLNACYREARKEMRRCRAEQTLLFRSPSSPLPDPSAAMAERDEIARAFIGLTPEQRALIVMHFYLGLPVGETATILGVPPGTVKSRLHRTTRQMRATLEGDAHLPLIEGRAT